VLVAAFALAVHVSSARHRQLEGQIAADAAALAAAVALVDDELLTDQPEVCQPAVIERARAAARWYAHCNRVLARPLELDVNRGNDPRGEVVCGSLAAPRSRAFDLNLDYPSVNAVRVAVRRWGAAAAATAYVDRDVIGFQPQGRQPLPVVPLAVLTDPSARDERSWDFQIRARKGTFTWFIDPRTGRPRRVDESAPQDDRIPEMTVFFSADSAEDNGRVTAIGGDAAGRACRQVERGIAREDLSELGGRLLLGSRPEAPDRLTLPRLHLAARDLEALARALRRLAETGERRVWLLYAAADVDLSGPTRSTADVVAVVGFVAARVLWVEWTGSGRLGIVLQPSMKITTTAVTDAARRHGGPRGIWNPYVCKVRLVE
jgi:hypothetical protein